MNHSAPLRSFVVVQGHLSRGNCATPELVRGSNVMCEGEALPSGGSANVTKRFTKAIQAIKLTLFWSVRPRPVFVRYGNARAGMSLMVCWSFRARAVDPDTVLLLTSATKGKDFFFVVSLEVEGGHKNINLNR